MVSMWRRRVTHLATMPYDNAEDDPMRLFFSEDVDLYEVLDVAHDASVDTIRKAYRRLALTYHPDKAALHGHDAEAVAQKFQQVGFAYSILSDEKRRKRYDATGSTSDSIWDSDEPVDWNEYFKTLWTGEVNAKTLDEFKSSYQNSDDERNDILQAYRDHKGSLEGIFSAVPCSNILDDEKRFIRVVNDALRNHDLEPTPAWSELFSDQGKKMRKALRKKAHTEANEAEAYAKELGVWDDLFGKKRNAPAKPTSTEEDDVDLEGLRAAMRAKASKRAASFDAMLTQLEAKHARPTRSGKKRRAQ